MMTHGSDIYTYAKIAKCTADEIIDFSSNINLYTPNTHITYPNNTLTRYADTSYDTLKNIIASSYAIKSEQIALYNGATSAIYSLLQELKGKKVHLYTPLYGEYEKAVLRANKYLSKINRINDIENIPDKKSIVIFVNPSTPEGTYYDLKKLFQIWMQQKCTIIIDESFLEFEELDSCRNKINEYKKLYIIQSFSKFYSCAGVRVGAIFSRHKNIQKLSKELWNISSLDAYFLQDRLQDTNFITQTKVLHKIQKKELITILEESKIFDEIVPSSANFILSKTKNGEKLFTHLLENKILVRACQSFDYLDKEWLRFAVKDKESHQALKEALHAFA